MSAKLLTAFAVSDLVKNTGVDLSKSMGATAMLIQVPKNGSWSLSDLTTDFEQVITTAIHASKASRAYPMFGYQFPVEDIANGKDSDTIEVMANGSKHFVKYGFLNQTVTTTVGSIPYANKLRSFLDSGKSCIIVDGNGNLLMRNNGDGTYGGLRVQFQYAQTPDFADFKGVFKLSFQINLHPDELVLYGTIFQGGVALLDLLGLKDAKVTDATGSSTTKLKIGVSTVDSGVDMVALLSTPLAAVTNFVVTNASGVVQTISAAAIASGHIELTGTFTSGSSYTVALAAPSVLLAGSIEGYEGVVAATIAIP